MDRERLDKLLTQIGMTGAMQPLLESDSEAYARLEVTIDKSLNEYKGKIKVKDRTVDFGLEVLRVGVPIGSYPIGSDCHRFSYFKRHKNLQKALYWFRQHYGIKQVAKSMEEIVAENGVKRQIVDESIHFVVCILAQRYKTDIWYGTL